MDDRLVRELLTDHARNPRHYGDLSDPDIEWQATNPQCVGPTHPDGDQVTLQAVLSDDDAVIEAVRFRGEGCTLSQAGASLLTEHMAGTPVADVLAWESDRVEERVGMELTPSRLRCAELALAAFRHGIEARETDTDHSA